MGLFSLIQANIKMIDKFVWIAFFFLGVLWMNGHQTMLKGKLNEHRKHTYSY